MEDLYSKRMLACKGSDIKQAVKQERVYEKCHFLAEFEHFTTEACTDIQPRKSHLAAISRQFGCFEIKTKKRANQKVSAHFLNRDTLNGSPLTGGMIYAYSLLKRVALLVI